MPAALATVCKAAYRTGVTPCACVSCRRSTAGVRPGGFSPWSRFARGEDHRSFDSRHEITRLIVSILNASIRFLRVQR
jgi:hypothetical protein